MPRINALTLPPMALAVALALGASSSTVQAQEQSLRQRIDTEIQAAWVREKITPAPPADDSTFLRRLFLDLVGTIPTSEEAKRFLSDSDPNKRARLIDQLLDDPRFAAHQADVWDLVLFGRNPAGGDATR